MWAVAEILFGPPRSEVSLGALWLAAGLAFCFAGLSKYSAVFAPVGLFGYLACAPQHRHWLCRLQAYAGAALALMVFSPGLICNYQNHWASFAFQSGRAVTGFTFDAPAFGQTLSSELALLSPWIGAPLLIALAGAMRSRDANSGSRFLLWLHDFAPPVPAYAALREAADPSLVQLRLAVRLPAARALAECAERALASHLGEHQWPHRPSGDVSDINSEDSPRYPNPDTRVK